MTWNPSPEVAVARDAAEKLHADMCVVLYINTGKGTIGYASYGATKKLCAETKGLADHCFDAARQWLA